MIPVAEHDMLRMAILAVMLAVPAASDISSRTVPRDVMILCIAVSGCFLAYDLASGLRGASWYGLAALGAALGMAMPRLGLAGSADGYAVAAASAIIPEYGGFPVALAGTAVGLAGAGAAAAVYNAILNTLDAVRGREYCGGVSFLACHLKRAGERFAAASPGPRRAVVDGDTIKDIEGRDYFLPVSSEGIRAYRVMPAVAFIAAGIAAVCAYAIV